VWPCVYGVNYHSKHKAVENTPKLQQSKKEYKYVTLRLLSNCYKEVESREILEGRARGWSFCCFRLKDSKVSRDSRQVLLAWKCWQYAQVQPDNPCRYSWLSTMRLKSELALLNSSLCNSTAVLGNIPMATITHATCRCFGFTIKRFQFLFFFIVSYILALYIHSYSTVYIPFLYILQAFLHSLADIKFTRTSCRFDPKAYRSH